MTMPMWARDSPDRLLYASNVSGTWELSAWDRAADTHRQVTDRPEGTLSGRLDPSGAWIWWFDDERGDELGSWKIEAFDGDGEPRLATPGLSPAYEAGLAIGSGFAVIGRSIEDRTSIHLVPADGVPRLLYEHREDAGVAGLSRDEALVCVSHSEHGDSRHPALRVLTVDGDAVAELWDGPGRGLASAGWSRVSGDRRLLVLHERQDLPRPMVWWPETGETRELQLDLPGEVGASWYPDGSALLIEHDHRARVELLRLDLATEALQPVPTPPGTIAGARVRPDGEVWYAWSDSATPSEVRSGDAPLVRPPGDPAPGGVRYHDHDVGPIHVLVARPSSNHDRTSPVLLMIHGGPTWQDRDEFSPRVQAFVDHGFAVVLVNYRGSTGYGKA